MEAAHRIDEELSLWSEMQLGLRDLLEANPEFRESTEQRSRARRAQAERDFLESFLLRLERTQGDSPGRRVQVNVARTAALERLADLAHAGGNPREAEPLLQQGLVFAREAGYAPSLFTVLMALGHVYREMPEPALAEEHYKQALVYAALHMPHFKIPMVLHWLGMNAAATEGGLTQAIFLLDCASRFDPPHFSALVELQRCRIRVCQRRQVLHFAQPPYGTTCREVGLKAAALKALRNKPTELREAATYGVELARQQGEQHWERLFTTLLNETAQQDVASRPCKAETPGLSG